MPALSSSLSSHLSLTFSSQGGELSGNNLKSNLAFSGTFPLWWALHSFSDLAQIYPNARNDCPWHIWVTPDPASSGLVMAVHELLVAGQTMFTVISLLMWASTLCCLNLLRNWIYLIYLPQDNQPKKEFIKSMISSSFLLIRRLSSNGHEPHPLTARDVCHTGLGHFLLMVWIFLLMLSAIVDSRLIMSAEPVLSGHVCYHLSSTQNHTLSYTFAWALGIGSHIASNLLSLLLFYRIWNSHS